MAWKKAIAADYKDLILQIRNFCTKTTDTGVTIIGVTNVGTGTLYGTSSTESSVLEDWTITCTSGGSIEITGNPSPDVTGTFDESGTNDGKPKYESATHAAWWDTSTLYWYVTLIADVGTVPTNGFRLSNQTPVGTWEAFGTATGVPVSEGASSPAFSVTGSVSGAQAAASLLTPYSNGLVSFTILDGDVGYATGDTFEFPVETSTALWVEDDYDVTTTPSQPWLFLHGIGGGTDEIYVGFRGLTNSSTYWNIATYGFTGHVAGLTQPGASALYTPCSDTSFSFWLFMSSRSIRVVPVVGTVEEHCYAGWILPNQIPEQYNYPLFIGGTAQSSAELLGSVATSHSAYWNAQSSKSKFLEPSAWLTMQSDDRILRNNTDFNGYWVDRLGNIPLYPVTVGDTSADKIYGDVEGIKYVPNALSIVKSGDILASETGAYIIFQDTFRSGNRDIIAYDLM